VAKTNSLWLADADDDIFYELVDLEQGLFSTIG